MARASDTGTGLTSPPSTSTMPSRSTGANNPGRAMEARTASSVEPRRSQISTPVCSAVATAANGIVNSSTWRSAKWRRKKSISRWPLNSPLRKLTSMSATTSRISNPSTHCSKRSSSPAA